MATAFSALRRFGQGAAGGAGGSRFSIARSTVTSRQRGGGGGSGSRATSVYTSSDQSSGSGASTPMPAPAPGISPLGLSNAKIRLYIRETASKWRDLGSARLTIMRPTNAAHPLAPPFRSFSADGSGPGNPATTTTPGTGVGIGVGGAAAPGGRQTASDKRVLVVGGKGRDDTLLDVTLGESCFERVARTGIAVSVWENFEGGKVAKVGGVMGGRLRVYMIQMKSEAETAYTFSIVGRARY